MVFVRKECILDRQYGKLKPINYGPYKITKNINDNVYMDLPNYIAIFKISKIMLSYLDHNSRSSSIQVDMRIERVYPKPAM
ncbi:conserved hypothetical protein [Ricinus communis]|uniref:Tf2-1-like SH3-like domain-containing protein n=1 Tax=Ricinus communis TaxID=3988 RepID=B9RN28_RICCO|nr:conserved hypothetical protein [Ricinus communis]